MKYTFFFLFLTLLINQNSLLATIGTEFEKAIVANDIEYVQNAIKIYSKTELLEHNDQSSYCPLHVACQYGRPEILKLLLENGFAMYIKSRYLLHCKNSMVVTTPLLMTPFEMLLHTIPTSYKKDLYQCINILLEYDQSIPYYPTTDWRNSTTCLQLACKTNDINIMKIFLKHNIDICRLNEKGVSPLCYTNNPEIINLIANHPNYKFKISMLNKNFSRKETTLLHQAAQFCDITPQALEFFVQTCPNLNLYDGNKQMALERAQKAGNKSMIAALMKERNREEKEELRPQKRQRTEDYNPITIKNLLN